MKLLLDFLPIVIFFGVYKYTGDIIIATAVLIPATILQMGYTWLKTKTIEKMQLTTLVLVIVLGGATVLLQDKNFIMWKPTVVNWLFALVFIGSHFIGGKPIVQRMLASSIELPQPIWTRLSWAWIGFFVLMGILNIFVAYTMSEENWVNFKLFGMLGLTLVFVVLQGLYLSKHIQEPEDEEKKTEEQTSKEM